MDDLPAPSWSRQLAALGVPFTPVRRLLLVDDEPENLEVLSALLEEDYEIRRAGNGIEALAVVAAEPPFAAVLSDQRMPGMSGMELLGELSKRAPQMVRMMVTAYSDLGPMVAAVNEGSVHRFFLKPWNPDELRSAVSDAVWLFQARDALETVVGLLSERKRELQTTVHTVRRVQTELLAAERLSTVGRFSAGISHNIRNSLTVMMNLLELVQQNPADERVLASAQRAFQTLDALLRLVNDVNALGRGRLHTVTRGPVEMQPFLSRIVSAFQAEPLGQDRPISLAVDPSARVLMFDANRIRQALLALLRSVAQATGPRMGLELVVHPLHDGETGFEVVSPPPGAATRGTPEVAFKRSAASAPAFAEIELGLEICRVVADAHGGRLVVRPRPDRPETAVQLWISEADPENEEPS